MPRSPEEMRLYLAECSGKHVLLKLNTNRRTMLSVRPNRKGPGVSVSLHRVFLDAEDEVHRAVAGYLVGPSPEDRAVVRRFIEGSAENLQRENVYTSRPPRRIGTSRGRYYNLVPRAQSVNEAHFGGALDFRIAWGRADRTGNLHRRHVTLGTALVAERIIRIHPVLDNPHVPGWFLDFIIFHELLHLHIPPYNVGETRKAVHSPEFTRIERAHPHFEAAQDWEKKWIWKLMAAWEAGRDIPRRALTDFMPPPIKLPTPVVHTAPREEPVEPEHPPQPAGGQLDLFGEIMP